MVLSQELRKKLVKLIKENPKKAIKELEKDPRILDILLNSDVELKKTQEETKNEKIKYVNMTAHMQHQLKEQAEKLKQMDQAVDDILNTLGNQESREPGIQVRHDVRLLSDEELWIKFRQRSGE